MKRITLIISWLFLLKHSLFFGSEVELKYDDGTCECYLTFDSGEGSIWATRFTPDQYPFTLTKAKYFFYAGGAPSRVHVISENVTNLIDPIQVSSYPAQQWIEIDVPPTQINQGDFYIAAEWLQPSYPKIGGDANGPYAGLDYEGGGWTGSANGYIFQSPHHLNHLIRAIGTYTGVQEEVDTKSNAGIVISPNPSIGPITIKLATPSIGTTKLRVYDYMGRLVRSKNIEVRGKESDVVRLDGLKTGVYFYKISHKNFEAKGKFIIL